VRTARLRHRQTEYGEERHRGTEASRHQEAAKLIDALTNRLGPERVLRAEPVESHVPERSWKCVPAIDDPCPRSLSSMVGAPGDTTRPTTLFHPPEPAEAVALPDRPPSKLRWRGRDLAITAGIGPERIACEWWKQRPVAGHGLAPRAAAKPWHRAEAWERDYFRIRDEDGRWLWVFRESPLVPPGPGGPVSTLPPRWFIHGLWS
jgi:protein ImuB